MRVVFMGSPQLSVPSLEQLLDSEHEVVAVYTQPDKPAGRGRGMTASVVKEAALRWGLKVVQPESLRSVEALAQLAAFKPDSNAASERGLRADIRGKQARGGASAIMAQEGDDLSPGA